MTGELWIDYSGGTVSGSTMAKAGIAGAIRYVGIGGSGKRLTRAEYADHCAHGRQTLAVVEQTTTDADGGYNAGVINAGAAKHDLALITAGLPPIPIVLAANDKPGYTAADVDYVRAFRDVFAGEVIVGPYGFASFLSACAQAGLAPVGWQAGPAPSRTGTAAVATWWQRNGGPVNPNGVDGPAGPLTITLDGVVCDLSTQLLEIQMTTLDDKFQSEYYAPDGSRSTVQLSYADAIRGLDARVYWLAQLMTGEQRLKMPDGNARNVGDFMNYATAQFMSVEGVLSQDQAALLAAIHSAAAGGIDLQALANDLAATSLPTGVAQALLAVLDRAAHPTSA